MRPNGTNQPEPELVDNSEQVLDPMTAYQITSMMEGVVQRGTGATVAELGRPIAGKTGTTNDEKDAWFIGYTPNLVVGLYMGYDKPQRPRQGRHRRRPRGADLQGIHARGAGRTRPIVDFQVPEGMKLIAINRKTGMRASEGDAGTIIEAFKPGTGPADSYWVIGMGADGSNGAGGALSPQANRGHPGRRRRPLLSRSRAVDRWAGLRRPAHFALQAAAPSLCIAPIQPTTSTTGQNQPAMRAETQNIVDEIRQAITLLRRHL